MTLYLSIKEWEQLWDVQWCFCSWLMGLQKPWFSLLYFRDQQQLLPPFPVKFTCRFITCELSSIKKIHPGFLYRKKVFLMLDATQCFMGIIILTAFPESLLFYFSHSLGLVYCCWQTRFHTYPSWPLWQSLSLPHWNWGNVFSLRGSDSLLRLSDCLILCVIPSLCLCWWVFWRKGISMVMTPTFGMVSSSWSIVLMHCSALEASVQQSHVQNIKNTLSLRFATLSALWLLSAACARKVHWLPLFHVLSSCCTTKLPLGFHCGMGQREKNDDSLTTGSMKLSKNTSSVWVRYACL